MRADYEKKYLQYLFFSFSFFFVHLSIVSFVFEIARNSKSRCLQLFDNRNIILQPIFNSKITHSDDIPLRIVPLCASFKSKSEKGVNLVTISVLRFDNCHRTLQRKRHEQSFRFKMNKRTSRFSNSRKFPRDGFQCSWKRRKNK